MKKNSFLEGAMIATTGIILCKIIGLIYVIPFYSLIGVQGGTLYGYAYSIYAVFLSLSSVGIPIAISKIVSEYIALGYNHTKERVFKIGATILIGLGIFFFLIMLIFAPQIAYLIIGDLQGGNTIKSVSLVIRIVASALLIVPLFSVTKGYLQGHKMMTTPSVANVIEQLVRVTVIVVGSYLVLKVFKLSVNTAVGISVFAATVGAFVGYFYVVYKIKKNKDTLKSKEEISDEERKITTKDIVKKLIVYAVPFIVIDLINSAYSMVDTFTVVRTMTDLGYTASVTETTYGILSTWGTKLNMIVISIAIGLCISLIPNISSSFIKKDYKDLNKKINQSLQALLMIVLPMTLGIFFLAKPVWTIFYGYDVLSISIFRIFIFQALTFAFYTVLIDILQSMSDSKVALGTLGLGFVLKAFLNIPCMILFNHFGVAYFGSIFATVITQIISIIVLLVVLRKKYKIAYKESFINGLKIICASIIMIASLYLLSLIIPLDSITRMASIVDVVIYAGVGSLIYFLIIKKFKLIEHLFGNDFFKKIFKRK